jgi:hypothetical protein
MLKRNLIIIAVISLSIVLTSNALGQNNKRKRTTKKAKVVTTTNGTTTTNASPTNPPAGAKYEAMYVVELYKPRKPTTNAKTTNQSRHRTKRGAKNIIYTHNQTDIEFLRRKNHKAKVKH